MAFPRKKKSTVKIAKLWADSPEELKDSEDNVLKPRGKGSRSTKSTYNGIDFDSQLEVYCYKALTSAGLEFEYAKKTYTIIDSFECSGDSYEPDKRKGSGLYKKSKKLQSIKYTPDFIGKNWIIETKGKANELWPMRLKLFKKYLTDNNLKYDIYIPKNHKQVDECINLINEKNKLWQQD